MICIQGKLTCCVADLYVKLPPLPVEGNYDYGEIDMITNLENESVQQKIGSETGNAIIKSIFDHISNVQGKYVIETEASGLEFMSTAEIRGFPNRCRLKVFKPEDNKIMAWFYKPSAVHFSRDRYSLGGVVLDEDQVDPGSIGKSVDQWLVWLDSGLDPKERPDNWKSAVPYDIPN